MAELEARMLADTLWLRAEFFRLVPCLTTDEIAVLMDQPSEDARATVTRWLTEARIFHVARGPAEFYPAFQFGPDLNPLPIIGELLEIFGRYNALGTLLTALMGAGTPGDSGSGASQIVHR